MPQDSSAAAPRDQAAWTHANQRVLITTAAAGIGRATAQAFVAAGAKVFICDVDAQQLASTLGSEPGLAGALCDVSDEAQVAALFKTALGHLGGLDILINNAGVACPTALPIGLRGWRRIQRGVQCVGVNNYFNATTPSPVGGHKQPGYGRENGIVGMQAFPQTKSI